jgi:hypothetical protein
MNSTENIIERYIRRMLEESALLMELVDRDRYSPAYGCFYYPYWRSKSSDFVNARCQEASYTLALLYRNEYPGSQYRGLLQCGELARAGMLFWAGCRHRDGSFDEWYRGEHGFAATAFSAFAISRAFLLLRDEFSPRERERLTGAFCRAGDWLRRHDDLSKINHEAVGAAALFSLAEVLENDELRRSGEEKVERVISRQTGEGWFPELGGLDTGYSFLTLEYLAQCFLLHPDRSLQEALLRALDFLAYFVHPDMTTGREYNLCGNSYVSLLAGAILNRISPLAGRLFMEGISRGNILTQLAQDDLSRCYHLYNGLLAYDHWRENRESFEGELPPLPYAAPPFWKYFPEASVLVVRRPVYYALASGDCGGVLKVYPSPQESPENDLGCHDLGYTITTPSEKELHSYRLSRENEIVNRPEGVLEVTASFRAGSYFFPHLLARSLLQLVSALPGGYLLIKKGIDVVRSRKKASFQLSAVSGDASPWSLNRSIRFGDDSVEVIDEIMPLENDSGVLAAMDLEIREGGRVIRRSSSGREREMGEILRGGNGVRIEKTIVPGPTSVEIVTRIEECSSTAPAREAAPKKKKNWILRVAQAAVLAVICFFLGKNLYLNWSKLISYSWEPNLWLLALSLFLMIACGLLVAVGWNFILKSMGQRVSHLRILRIYFFSELGKYLPGKIWTIVGRTLLAQRAGVPKVMTVASIGIMLGIMVVSGILVTLLTLPVWPTLEETGNFWYFIFLVPLVLLALHPRIFDPVLNWGLRKFENLELKVSLRYRDILSLVLYWGGLWILKGIATYVLLIAVYHEPLPSYALISLIGMVAITWVAGTFSFFPAGLGITEFGIAVLFQSLLGVDLYLATAIAVFIRVWGIIAELICIGLTCRFK